MAMLGAANVVAAPSGTFVRSPEFRSHDGVQGSEPVHPTVDRTGLPIGQ